MKILIIGLGSIGQRHVQTMEKVINARFIYFPSEMPVREADFIQKHGIDVFQTLDECVRQHPDFAIIANATPGHISIAKVLVENNIPFMIEKPVAISLVDLDELCEKINKQRLQVLVGFQLRHHPTFNLLQEIVDSGQIGTPLLFHGYVGQYLPDWRPQKDYRETVSASKSLGGGVLADICHEFDIAVTLLGPVSTISADLDRLSDLAIDTEDIANLSLVHKNRCHTNIHLNYLDRKYTWQSRLVGSEGTILWDYTKGFLELTLSGQKNTKVIYDPPDFSRKQLFEKQAKHWLAVLSGTEQSLVSFEDGCEITKLIVAANASSKNRAPITL